MGARLLLAVLVCLFALSGCNRTPPDYESNYTPSTTAPPPPVSRVAVIGDSYTGGVSDVDLAWPMLATEQLRNEGVWIDPKVGSEGGSGYLNPGKKGGVFADRIPEAVTRDDSLVVLFGSLNDAKAPLEALPAAVQRTFNEVKAAAPQAKLLIIGPPSPTPAPSPEVLAVRDVMKAQASAVGATFVDPLAERWFFDIPELIGSDGVHPTEAGQRYMSEKIAPLIAKQLSAPTA